MSALLEKPLESTTTTATRQAPRRHAMSLAPAIAVRQQVVSRPIAARKVNSAHSVLVRTALFVSVMGFVYAGSSLWGQVRLEGARQARISATSRAIAARQAQDVLSRQVNHMTSAAEIERWAVAHNMVSPDGIAHAELVAKR